MPLREVLCLSSYTGVLFPLWNQSPHTEISTRWETSSLQGTTGPQLPQTVHKHSALRRLVAPASRWRSGSASNSPATKKLQPSRTTILSTSVESGRMEVAQVDKQICESEASLCHGIRLDAANLVNRLWTTTHILVFPHNPTNACVRKLMPSVAGSDII